ncbi:hypothetical protein MP638_005622 [Amoeboaphelidium occidentale]|nr:hypothetical protein MP638_005622 [Amoeboaphelidium occidentale]
MFNRLRNLVSETISATAVIKSRVETLKDHWNYVRQSIGSTDRIEDTNIPYHLESIVKYIKQEELEYLEEKDELMTGECMGEVLERRMLEELVSFGDNPRGLLKETLKMFSLLLSNLHQIHRLLPERSVRLPLLNLIATAHAAQMHSQDLTKLINVLLRQLRANPALLNLFITSDSFDLLSILMAYVWGDDDVARESLCLGVCLAANMVPSYIESDICDAIVQKCSETFSSHGFFDVWSFAVDLLVELTLKRNESMERLKKYFCNQLVDKVVKEVVFVRLLSANDEEIIAATESFVGLLKIVRVELLIDSIVESLFHYDLHDLNIQNVPNSKGGQIISVLVKRIASAASGNRAGVVTLLLFGVLLESFSSKLAYEYFVFHNLPSFEEKIKYDPELFPSSYLTDEYYALALERSEVSFKAYNNWYPNGRSTLADEEKTEIAVYFLDLVVGMFEKYYSNSVQTNLVLTGILATVLLVPDSDVQTQLLMKGEGRHKSFMDMLRSLMNDTGNYSALADAVKSHCNGEFELVWDKLGLISFDTDATDIPAILSSNVPAPGDSDFSLWFSNHIILEEFCKEAASITLIINKNMTLNAKLR